MNPLVILGRVSESIDALLFDGHPVTGAQLFTSRGP
jgi:hypothetical protein